MTLTTTERPTTAGDVAYEPAPIGVPDSTPRVFIAVAAVMQDAMPVAKNQRNTSQNYQFRGIDDVMSAMAGPMRKHGVFIVPTIADHRAERRGEKMTHVVITMRYRIYGPAGDCLVATVPGEASDFADKAVNKAQSAALKYLLFTLFMLPVDGRSIDDGDRDHPVQPDAPERPTQQQERRDFLADARRAPSPQAFAAIRQAAEKAGAPDDYLAQLDAIAKQRAEQAQQRQQSPDPTPPSTPARGTTADGATARATDSPAPEPETLPGAPATPGNRLDALAALYRAGEAHGMTQVQTREVLTQHTGKALSDATAEDIASVTAALAAAQGGAR